MGASVAQYVAFCVGFCRSLFLLFNLCVVCPSTLYYITSTDNIHDRIFSLTGNSWAHKISLATPCFIEVPVPNEDSESLCISVIMVLFLFFLRFSNWILELFRQCRIFCFFFILQIQFTASNYLSDIFKLPKYMLFGLFVIMLQFDFLLAE